MDFKEFASRLDLLLHDLRVAVSIAIVLLWHRF